MGKLKQKRTGDGLWPDNRPPNKDREEDRDLNIPGVISQYWAQVRSREGRRPDKDWESGGRCA